MLLWPGLVWSVSLLPLDQAERSMAMETLEVFKGSKCRGPRMLLKALILHDQPTPPAFFCVHTSL